MPDHGRRAEIDTSRPVRPAPGRTGPRPSGDRARLGLVLSATGLVLVIGAWLLWPTSPPRIDIRSATLPTSTLDPRNDPAMTTIPSTTIAPAPTTAPAPPAPVATPVGTPTRLLVPASGIEAEVVSVGLDSAGLMELPPVHQVGWYELGPRPAEPGSAVIAGHIDDGGLAGPFARLATIPIGAEITVEDSQGGSRRFQVAALEQIPKHQIDLSRYFTRQGPDRLTLITCGGAFDTGAGHYDDNIVVTAYPT
jgi:hypothetical protein